MFSTTATCSSLSLSPSGDVAFVCFKPQQLFTFVEGQFVVIETFLHNKTHKRSYSIATTNIQLQNEGTIGFIVKKTAEGGMSEYLTRDIKVGDTITIKGPVGHYVDKKISKKYLLISVGSGLGPNYALYKNLVDETQDYERIVHIFGERFHSNILADVEQTFTKHPQENIHHFLHLSQETSAEEHILTTYRPGRIQQSVPEALELLGNDLVAYICGTPIMVNEVRNLLLDHGIEPHQIIIEKY